MSRNLKSRREFFEVCLGGALTGAAAAQALPARTLAPGARSGSLILASHMPSGFISNIRETTISTNSLEDSIHFYCEHFGFQIRHMADLRDGAWKKLWRLPVGIRARAALLDVSGAKTGTLRLVQFVPPSKTYAHLPYRTLDTGYGGIDMEVPDMTTRFESFVRHGHARVTAPIQYEPPGSALMLNEAVVLGPTGERIPMVYYREVAKRNEPMITIPEFTPVLAVFQIVEDLKRASEVYQRLGLQITRERETSIPSVNRALGLPVDTRYRAYQMANLEERFGRPILVQYLNKRGENLSLVSRPPNLGLIMTSYRVADLDEAQRRLQGTEAEVMTLPVEVENALYGKTRAMTFKHPSGAWVELYT